MASEAKPRLDMSLDEIIQLHKKESGPKGKGKETRAGGQGRGSGRGTGRARGIKVQNRDPKAARAQEAQNRSAAGRQAKLAKMRGLPVSQHKNPGVQKSGGQGSHRGVSVRPRGGFRGRGSRGRGNVRVGGGRAMGGGDDIKITDQDLSRIRITIDNPLYNQRLYQQQHALATQPLTANIPVPAASVWGSAFYTNTSTGPATGQGTATGYVPLQGGRNNGTTAGAGRGFGRGDTVSRRGGGSGRSGSQRRGRNGGSWAGDSPYGGYPAAAFQGGSSRMHVDAPVRMTSNSIRY